MADAKRPRTAQEVEMDNKRQRRRRRSRRRALIRVLMIVVICGVILLLWQNWDVLAPDRLMDSLQDWMGSGTGSYPVDVSGLTVHRIAASQDYTVMLSDSHLVYYDAAGGEVNRYACTYSSALMRTAGRYVLLAEQEGKRLQLYTRTAALVTMDVDQDILSVAVNEEGQFAVLTRGPQGYAVQVRVYDQKGKLLYTRSRNQMATEVALSADGTQVALLSVQAVNGTLNTDVAVFALNSADTGTLCTHTARDTLLYRLEYLTEGWLAAIGENGVIFLDTTDGLATVFAPKDVRILGYAAGAEDLALVTRPYGSTGGGQVHIVAKSGELRCTVDFTGEFRHIGQRDDTYALLTDSYVQALSGTGAGGTAAVSADGQQVIPNGTQAVVLGLNRLEAHDVG